MRRLPMPADDPGEVFRTCISKVTDTTLKQRLTAVETDIVTAADLYNTKASAAQLHTLTIQTSVGGSVTSDEMSAVYDLRMAKKGAPGRPIYDRIRLAAVNETCPLCGVGRVSTVDHHLPKAHYPALAVVPANLVPACSDCNKAKGDRIPRTEDQQPIHPYFDNIQGETWLYAEVIEGTPPVVQYFVRGPNGWSERQASRVEYHFKLFRLATLYGSNAADELVNIQYSMDTLLQSAGYQGVKSHLQMQASSYSAAHANSWQAAMYKALADSDWYCGGPFSM